MNEVGSIIIGGGFFGMYIAHHLKKKHKHDVLVIERESDFMQRASYSNQARVHNGYHYPRSTLTALRSRISFPKFVDDFEECIDYEFEKYYAIGKNLTKVTSRQFTRFCDRINAYCEPAPASVKKLFSPHLVEDVFSTKECAFDAIKLKKNMSQRLSEVGVEPIFNTTVLTIAQLGSGSLELTVESEGEVRKITAKSVYNCSYSRLNYILNNSNITVLPLVHELTEIALIKPPDILKDKGITVMCGPFFSTMPFPSTEYHSLTHVRYTPHFSWDDVTKNNYLDPYKVHKSHPKNSSYRHMKLDASRYLPCMKDSIYHNSLWEVKTTLPQSSVDDGRPILFKSDYVFKNLHCILGGKIDNIYDVIEAIDLNC